MSDDLFKDQHRLTGEATAYAFYDQITSLRTEFSALREDFTGLRDNTEKFGNGLMTHMTELAREMRLLKDTSYEQLVESRVSNTRMGKNQFPASVIVIITLVYGIAFIGVVFGTRDLEMGAPGGWHFQSKAVVKQ